MTSDVQKKFVNQICIPWSNLRRMLVEHPWALEPESNAIIHQFEGLAIHLNHFAEKNKLERRVTGRLNDIANSVKHKRGQPETQVSLLFGPVYECTDEGFRFVRNRISASYPGGENFDAIEEAQKEISAYSRDMGVAVLKEVQEQSAYGFFRSAFAYANSNYGVHVGSTRVQFVRIVDGEMIPVEPGRGSFVVLSEETIGHDPEPLLKKLHT